MPFEKDLFCEKVYLFIFGSVHISRKQIQLLFWQFFRNLEERYNLASITRNNLVAASQNIQGAQRYLSNIVFPYCAPPEVETLNKVYKT